MIETEGVQPGGVLELRFSGQVSGPDYDMVMIPAIETALEEHSKLRVLCVFDEGFEGYDLEAAWDDARVGLRHWNAYERFAIVTDVTWLRQVVRAAGFAISCPIKVFPLDEAEDARRWLRESLGSIHLEFDDDAHQATIRMLGKLEPQAYEDVAVEIDGWMSQHDHIRLLLDLREFDGWQGLGALTEHLALIRDHRRVMERVALVGDEAWQKMAVRVVSQFLRGEARYFGHDDIDAAEQWLRRD